MSNHTDRRATTTAAKRRAQHTASSTGVAVSAATTVAAALAVANTPTSLTITLLLTSLGALFTLTVLHVIHCTGRLTDYTTALTATTVGITAVPLARISVLAAVNYGDMIALAWTALLIVALAALPLFAYTRTVESDHAAATR